MASYNSRDLDADNVPAMTFSSSPIEYPESSAPVPVVKQKRKLFQSLNIEQPTLKKPKLCSKKFDILQDDFDTTYSIDENKENATPHLEAEDDPVFITSSLAAAPVTKLQDSVSDDFLPSLNLGRGMTRRTVDLQTCSGKTLRLGARKKQAIQTYEEVVAERSITAAGRGKKAYYGIDIHQLIDDAKIQEQLDESARELKLQKEAELQPGIEESIEACITSPKQAAKYQMWTEKYRAKKFTELVGDERTHRSVLKWLKGWDSIVFPGNTKAKVKPKFNEEGNDYEQIHRKIMLLTGPPGLGKTTLAHVCAKQAGYEVLEINASDDRSRDVVKGRIKDALGTETVRGIQEPGKARRSGRPVCVVVDEVDGVVTGSGGSGEGGFMKALLDLVHLDQQNRSQAASQTTSKKKKGDKFRLLRPLILICNDVYAPSLRPLRQSSMAEIVHVRKPPIEKVVARLKHVFEKESIRCDNDAVRRLCEDCWGMGSRKQSSRTNRGVGDGDIRGVLVQGEWMAHKLRLNKDDARLTRKWLETQITQSASTKSQRGLGRGGAREVVDRIFVDGAGLSHLPTAFSAEETRLMKASKATALGVADLRKRSAINALREMIDTCGDHDRVMTDCFSIYPTQSFQDDTFLSKPNASYDWLYFHDSLSSRIFSGQEWELNPYLNTSACAFHSLFASVDTGASGWSHDNEKHENEEQPHPFSGPKADFAAHEMQKQNSTMLTEMQGNFSGELLRIFSTPDIIATELIPNVNRILSPDVKPVVVGGSGGGPSVASVRKETERNCVRNAVQVMNALSVSFEKVRIENEGYGGTSTSGGYALRMEP